MPFFYLSEYRGSGTELDPFRPYSHDGQRYESIDLRPFKRWGNQALVRVAEEYYPAHAPTVPLGDSLRVDLLDGLLPRLIPEIDGVARLWLGGPAPIREFLSPRYAEALVAAGLIQAKKSWTRRELFKYAVMGGAGLYLASLPKLAHASTISETWPQADSTDISTGSDRGTWVEDSGDVQIVGNALVPNTTVICHGRETGGVATADHKCSATVNIVSAGSSARNCGPVCRKDNDASNTFYFCWYGRNTSALSRRLSKIVAGSITDLISDAVDAGAGNLTVFVQANGSTISGGIGTANFGPVFDSGITGNTRGGYRIRCNGTASDVKMLDWTLEDLTAPAAGTDFLRRRFE